MAGDVAISVDGTVGSCVVGGTVVMSGLEVFVGSFVVSVCSSFVGNIEGSFDIDIIGISVVETVEVE